MPGFCFWEQAYCSALPVQGTPSLKWVTVARPCRACLGARSVWLCVAWGVLLQVLPVLGLYRGRSAVRLGSWPLAACSAESFVVRGWEHGTVVPRPCPGTGRGSICNKPSFLGEARARRSLVLELILCPWTQQVQEVQLSADFSKSGGAVVQPALRCSRCDSVQKSMKERKLRRNL